MTPSDKLAAMDCTKHLWLFDIDGTLVNINHVHLETYKRCYRGVLQRELPDELVISSFGMTEHETHAYLLREIGMKADDALIGRLAAAYPRHFAAVVQAVEVRPLPGVVAFLKILQAKGEHLGIVTGNLAEPARLILERSGLARFFPLVAFDDGHRTRVQIITNAIEQAQRRGYAFETVIVVGDTTKDIAAAKEAAKQRTDVKIVAVGAATGSDDAVTLRKAGADAVLLSFAELPALADLR